MAYSLITIEQTKSPIAEAYRTLRTNLQYANVDSGLKRILITSAGAGEGKSVTVANLAVSMAQAGKSVLVIDADLRNPVQHKLFGLENLEGLSVALTEERDYTDYIQETTVDGVMVLTAGPIPPNPAELVGSKRMKCLVEEVSGRFDLVLFDTPPIIAVTDAAILVQEADGVILVLASGQVIKDYARRAKELLDNVGAKILGAVLNKADIDISDYYHYYHNDHNGSKKKHRRHKAI